MARRGRKKGSKNTRRGEPHNFNFWRFVLANPKDVDAFIKKGNETQHQSMKQTVKYLQQTDLEFFETINGKGILRRLK